MTKNFVQYKDILGEEFMEEIHKKAVRLAGKHIVCVSSTYQGGGVAEMLNSSVFLFNEIGIDFGWRILHGTPDFFNVTKKIHNALQGQKCDLSLKEKQLYKETNHRFSTFTHIKHDLVVVHDPQPLPLISFYPKKQPWIFRAHIDLSTPHEPVWEYLRGYVSTYDHFVVSREEYKRSDIDIPQSIIHPAIDPFSLKNRSIKREKAIAYLRKFHIDISKKPLITQVSRFDKWKDPIGVLRIFERVRKEVDCQLVLIGSFATDDPEGQTILESVENRVRKSLYKDDVTIIIVSDDVLVNAIQQLSAVVIQKSLREGFGLTISEALYKGTPVVASRVGGIPLQVIDGVNGFLHDPQDIRGFSESTIKLLRDKKLRETFGRNGREHVKENFLMTRLLSDWLSIFEQHLR